MSSSLRPSTPPAALISSMASTTPWWEVWPQPASLPVSEAYSPTLMGSCACATAANAARARRRLGVFMAKWAWRSGVDVLHEREAAVLHREDDRGFRWVALRVEGDRPGNAGEIFRGSESIAKLGAVGGAGALEGVDEEHRGIVAERRERVGGCAPAFLEAFVEPGNGRRLVFGRIVRAEKTTLDGLAADGDEFGRFPAVGAEQWHGEAEVAGLFADERRLGVIGGRKDAVHAGGANRRELRAKILVALAEFFLDHHDAGFGGK